MERNLEDLVCAMSIAGKVDVDALLSPSRDRRVVYCRYFLFYYLNGLHELTTTEIGQMFGRDHATVIYGTRKAEEMLSLRCFKDERMLYERFLNEIGYGREEGEEDKGTLGTDTAVEQADAAALAPENTEQARQDKPRAEEGQEQNSMIGQ